MRSLLFLIAIPLGFAFTTTAPGEYCNARFGYCMTYPSDLFNGRELSDNGDGIRLFVEDSETELAVTGSYNVMDWSLDDVYRFVTTSSMEELVAQEIVRTDLERNAYEVTFRTPEHIYYHRTQMFDEVFVTIQLRVAASDGEELENLREQIDLNVNL